MERNIGRIADLTPEQIGAVHRIMARNARYADELTKVAEFTNSMTGEPISALTSDMEIRAVLYTMAGTLQVTTALDTVLEQGS